MTFHDYAIRFGLGIIIAPAMAIVLFGIARIVAMVLVRWMPESKLKQKLLTDTDTRRLAYTPKIRR